MSTICTCMLLFCSHLLTVNCRSTYSSQPGTQVKEFISVQTPQGPAPGWTGKLASSCRCQRCPQVEPPTLPVAAAVTTADLCSHPGPRCYWHISPTRGHAPSSYPTSLTKRSSKIHLRSISQFFQNFKMVKNTSAEILMPEGSPVWRCILSLVFSGISPYSTCYSTAQVHSPVGLGAGSTPAQWQLPERFQWLAQDSVKSYTSICLPIASLMNT